MAIESRPATTPGPTPVPGRHRLEARDISAWFGAHQVLDRVSLAMEARQVTALIGPSGCGKSTFLRILNRMHELIPSASLAGDVLLDGADIYDPRRKLTEARRHIGMVFQKPNPFPTMSIYDNVLAGLQLTGDPQGPGRRRTSWSRLPDQGRPVERGREPAPPARAGRCRVVSSSDCASPGPWPSGPGCCSWTSRARPSTRRRPDGSRQTIEELRAEVTIVIVTHNMQQAQRVSDYTAFFLAEQGTPGYIIEHGPTDAMFDSPQDPRTLDYVHGRFG